jgi:hypothetical protein
MCEMFDRDGTVMEMKVVLDASGDCCDCCDCNCVVDNDDVEIDNNSDDFGSGRS